MGGSDAPSEAVGLEDTRLIVVMGSDEISLKPRCQVDLRTPQAVHADDHPGILDVGLDQPGERRHSDDKN